MFSYIKMNKLEDKINTWRESLSEEQQVPNELILLEEKLEEMFEHLEVLEDARSELQEAQFELSNWRKENETIEI
tara:strand:- start:6338 stop:6562 length:225 start_codon:yes stop_codon:yes gene_type:complete